MLIGLTTVKGLTTGAITGPVATIGLITATTVGGGPTLAVLIDHLAT